MSKKIITKNQFLKINKSMSLKMSKDISLQKDAIKIFTKADKLRWVHQALWMGEPVLNLPQDMFAIQEIIYSTKPDYIIEIGQAWGGGLLFYATLLKMFGGKKVIGVDIFIPADLKKRLKSKKSLVDNIHYLQADSTQNSTFEKIKKITKNSKKVMVILDSHHTHEHVLQELKLYSRLVKKGFYLICSDTIINYIPKQYHRQRPWGPQNNPYTALKEFLKTNKRFKIDKEFNNKFLFSCHPNGYLKSIK